MDSSGPVAAVLEAIRDTAVSGKSVPVRICWACAETMPIDGAAICLIGGNSQIEPVGSSDESTAQLEELQVTLGEGPAFDAIARNEPVLVEDLRVVDPNRWPLFAQAIVDRYARSMFVFPLQFGAVRLGALTLYRRVPGHLSATELSDALRVGDVIAMLFLGRDGDLRGDFEQQWLDESSWTREVHQATGMLVVQFGASAAEAFVRLRAHAFAQGMPLSDVARDVISRRVRLGD